MTLGKYVLRRGLSALLLIFLVSSAALVLTRLAPGDVLLDQIGTSDPALRARLRAEAGLDRPFAEQYFDWLGDAARLDFGRSLLFSRPVNTLLRERALNTATLAVAALFTATILGIPAGVYTGSRTRGALRRAITLLSLLLVSVPPLIGALVLVLIAARTGWLPIGGMSSAAAVDASWSVWLIDLLRHLPVPALALALPLAASLERLQSQAMVDAMREPFVDAARARGVSADRAVMRHAWPVSLAPLLGIYGVVIGTLFSGSFVVEVVTAWPGLGRLMYDAIRARDLYLVAGCAAAGAFCLTIGTLIGDVLLTAVDPRQREGQPA